MRIVDVVTGRDGQPDGVSLGDVKIPFAASVGGRVDGVPPYLGGDVVDETSGLTSFILEDGTFRIDGLSVGEHLFKFAVVDPDTSREWVGEPRRVRIEESAQSSVVPLADISLRPATTALGHLRFRLLSLHAGVTAPDVLVTVTERLRGALATTEIPAPTAAGWIELDLPEGIYQVGIAAPPPYDTEVTAPALAIGIVIAGQVADLGSLYLVPPGVPQAAQLLCVEDADCGKAGACTGSCPVGWSPQQAAPASVPLCTPLVDYCTPAEVCVALNGAPGRCFNAGNGDQVCVPCGQDCTVNGLTVFHGACP
jgi:hypothetical protein